MPKFIILHFTAMEDGAQAIEWLCDPKREVSAHYVLDKSGEITQLVRDEHRAWHAGLSYWQGIEDMNSASLGIELDNNGAQAFEAAQYDALINLIRNLQAQYDIPPENVLGHQDIAIGRKFDPGPWFDWSKLDRAMVAKPPFAKITQGDFCELAQSAGYNPDASLEELLYTIRMRHQKGAFFAPYSEADRALLTCLPSSDLL